MRVSEHANYLLNEYGRLQFDYAAFCKPDGESLRNEARNNLEVYIAKLEEENDRLQSAWFVEETICPDGSLKPKVSTLLSRIAELAECIGSQMADVYTLKAHIAELEAENIRLGIEYQRMRLALGDIAINSKRALKESPTDHLTAQWRQERQDDKSSNDTQT